METIFTSLFKMAFKILWLWIRFIFTVGNRIFRSTPSVSFAENSDLLLLEKVTRVEVIDENGRSYLNWNDNNKVELSFQDEDRTLKVFISKRHS
jgi:hypothetical protein